MSAVIGAIVGILSLVLGEKYIVSHDANGNQLVVTNANTGQTVGSFPLSLKPVKFFLSAIGRTSSTATSKPIGAPQIQFKNPYNDQKVTVVNISLVPDATFKLHGIVEVDINGRVALAPQAAGSFTDLTDFQIPIPEEGTPLDEGQTIDVYVWSDNAANNVSITASFGVVQ